jgi:D-alanyl-D-alanine carboxypeptidase/D-alanyl-D-alanine-endopeptidase (penicillin-binding protein 4)
MKTILSFCLFMSFSSLAQTPTQQVLTALDKLKTESPYLNADISFTLLDNETGQLLAERNKNNPLAPASTLKTFTTATALKLLGKDFQFKTQIEFRGQILQHHAKGILLIYGSGDPSLGSDRFTETSPEGVKQQILSGLRKAGIQSFEGNVQFSNSIFTDDAINTGWLDEDIGNYYGAGIYPFNWKENKFELNLIPTKTSFEVSSNTAGYDNRRDFCIELTQKEGASTEEAFAFVEKNKPCNYVIRGVLSAKEKVQNMQLARLHPDQDFQQELIQYLQQQMTFKLVKTDLPINDTQFNITTLLSPPLSKLVYWCNQKSLNLYAESFCKTLAVKQFHQGSWQMGIATLVRYAKALGINTSPISLKDGCGLAPENRITTYILASLLRNYTKESFYPAFFESLPSINGITMKSGYIGGTRSYAGYITLKNGKKASFAFIVHNYTCSPKEVKIQMFKILDLLK